MGINDMQKAIGNHTNLPQAWEIKQMHYWQLLVRPRSPSRPWQGAIKAVQSGQYQINDPHRPRRALLACDPKHKATLIMESQTS